MSTSKVKLNIDTDSLKKIKLVAVAYSHKEKASFEDLEYVLTDRKFPVGVEWQGLFGDEDDDDETTVITASLLTLTERRMNSSSLTPIRIL